MKLMAVASAFLLNKLKGLKSWNWSQKGNVEGKSGRRESIAKVKNRKKEKNPSVYVIGDASQIVVQQQKKKKRKRKRKKGKKKKKNRMKS